MNEAAARIAEGLAKAIQTEFDGHNFYLMAAKSTEDEQGRQVFEQLAQEEMAHLRFLELQKRSYERTGKADPEAKLGAPMDLSGENPIFSPRIKDRLGEAHFEMSALSIGIQLEINSETYYREQAENSQDPVVKAFYTDLADWESGHYHALLRQQEALKEDFWAASGFAPF